MEQLRTVKLASFEPFYSQGVSLAVIVAISGALILICKKLGDRYPPAPPDKASHSTIHLLGERS